MFALNGTTYSSRKKGYLHYCPSSMGSEEYLTPTQRSSRTIRNLRVKQNYFTKIKCDNDDRY